MWMKEYLRYVSLSELQGLNWALEWSRQSRTNPLSFSMCWRQSSSFCRFASLAYFLRIEELIYIFCLQQQNGRNNSICSLEQVKNMERTVIGHHSTEKSNDRFNFFSSQSQSKSLFPLQQYHVTSCLPSTAHKEVHLSSSLQIYLIKILKVHNYISTMAKELHGVRANTKKLHGKFKNMSKSNNSNNPDRVIKGNTSGQGNTFRTKNTIKRLKMYDQKHPDKKKMYKEPGGSARVDPNRKWFGNVRTIDQKSLEKLRIEMARKDEDPTKIFVKAKKIPTSLLEEPIKENKLRLLQVQTYETTFGPNSRRKRVKLNIGNMDELIENVEGKQYDLDKDTDNLKNIEDDGRDQNRDKRMSAGQSKRIWDELHKVIDSSDVLVQVLDSRDPMGTRSLALEEKLKKNFPHKHLILLINKADLVPIWVIAKWVKYLSKFYPTIAYRSSISNPFGKGSLINLFRQFDIFHRDKKNISIGFVGYPNVGKSSVINSLLEKRVCKAAPVPGETKVWQYVTLTKRIYLIDCPGTVHVSEGKDDVESVLKGCVRAEKIDQPTYYIPYILQKVKRKDILSKMYGVTTWQDTQDFLKQVAIKKGKLRKGGEPDVDATAKIILVNWQKGEIPYFHLPEGEVDKFQAKHEQTIDNIKEQQFLQMVGAPTYEINVVNEEEEKDEAEK